MRLGPSPDGPLRAALVAAALTDLAVGFGLAIGFGLVFGSCATECLDHDVPCAAVCWNAWAAFPVLFMGGALYGLPGAALAAVGVAFVSRTGLLDRGAAAGKLAPLPAAVLGLLGGILVVRLATPAIPLLVHAWTAMIGGFFIVGIGLSIIWFWNRSHKPDPG